MASISQLLFRGGDTPARVVDRDDPGVVPIDDEEAGDVFAALSSETARNILAALYDQPRTSSELGDVVDTSLQNVNHHVDQLVEHGIVEVVDTRHSVQGRDMNVYGPSTDDLVLYAHGESGGAVGPSLDRQPVDSPGRLVLLGALLALPLFVLLRFLRRLGR